MHIVAYNTLTHESESISVNFFQVLKSIFGFKVSLGRRKYAKWMSETEVYLFHCSSGFVIGIKSSSCKRIIYSGGS